MINFTVNNHSVGTTAWMGEYLCIENSNAIIPICPKWLLKRLKDYNDNGEYVNRKDRVPKHDPETNMED